jgi:two-component system, OmpR family, phosphate regulon sensor histidine kinase PhoR
MGSGMDLRKRLVFVTLLALLLAIIGASAITTYTLQQQSQQQSILNQQQGLVGAGNIAVNGIIADELSRLQVAAKSLAINTDVQSALRYRSPGTVQDNLLEPYRVSSRLTFISLITTEPLSQIAQAKVLSPPELSSTALVSDSLRLQQDRSGIWDGPPRPAGAPVPQAPYAVAVSPVLAGPGPTLVGVVVVGRILDNTYVTQQLTNNLGDFQAAIVGSGPVLLALPTELEHAFTAAGAHRPYQPQVQAAARTVPLPNDSWHAATWQIGKARYVVVTRPLGFGSKDQLAVALAAAAPFGGGHLFPTPISLWLAGWLGITPMAAFSLVTRVLWLIGVVLLLAVVGCLVGIAIHHVFRPIPRLTERVEAFLQHQTWTSAPTGPGELGRLTGAVAALAGEASHWSAELTLYRDRLQSVLDSMGTGVVVSDNDGRVELINPAARELLGIDPGAAALAVPVARPISNGQAFQATNGRVINAISTPIRRHDGETLGLVTVLEDMTRERELERVRSDFLTVVSHELRTPLTAVKGSLDLLLDGDAGALEPLQQRFLQTARRNAERLISLVQDLLDLSRLEAGQVSLTLQPADIRRILDDVIIGLGAIFESKHQQVHVELPTQPVLVMADRRRFEQVVTNLLGNASNYTPEEGRIEVRAQPDPDAGQAVLTVRNSGPGIAPEDREHLFEKFYRGGNALTRRDGGSGLGLAIVKSLVDLHHGTIAVESEPGNGAAFIVRLPLAGDERANTGR